ncbi:hypothetical protein K0M31_017663, partial [Melipona bicolor]
VFGAARSGQDSNQLIPGGWSDRSQGHRIEPSSSSGGRIHTDKVHRRRQAKRRSAETSSPWSILALPTALAAAVGWGRCN